jgi:DNA-binding CsgD family transcriptional regulator
MESHIKGSRILALHLERCQSGPYALDELSSEYRLTDREREALRGIALGLTTKEVAERMNISPNTVKAFLRLIMLKMSVNTRAGITAKLFERQGESVGV